MEKSQAVQTLIDLALSEDLGEVGDLTSQYFVPADRQIRAFALVKYEGVIAGLEVAAEVFRKVDPELEVTVMAENGDRVKHGDHVIKIEGSARAILTAERTALNFLQRISGVASQARIYADTVEGTGATVLDTRKTTPGWRLLEKAAVAFGGCQNHRMGLYDRVMVKDNHLVSQSGVEAIRQSIAALKSKHPGVEVELEADRLDQVSDFLTLEHVDYILLDNMSLDQLCEAVSMRDASPSDAKLEASGGVTLDTLRSIAETGVDFISVGALTHSAIAADISLEFHELGE